MFNKSNRYMTKGINQTLDISLQIMLWQIIDDFKDTKEIELDYLQVFKIRRNKNELIIEHTQEVPEYKKVYLFNNLGSLIEEKIAMGTNMLICIVNEMYEESVKEKLKKYQITTLCEKNTNYSILFIVMKRKETKKISKIIKDIDKNAILISEKIKTNIV